MSKNIFKAGTDTSTIIVEWALAEILKNRNILESMQSEMDVNIWLRACIARVRHT